MYSSWGITKEINNYRVNFEDPPWDTHAPIRGVAIRRWIKSSGDLRRYTKVFCLKIKQNHFSTPTRSDRFESRHKQLQTRFRSKHDSFRSKYDSHQSTIHSDQSTIHSKVRFIRGFWVAGQGTISPTRVFTAGHDQPAGTSMGGGGGGVKYVLCVFAMTQKMAFSDLKYSEKSEIFGNSHPWVWAGLETGMRMGKGEKFGNGGGEYRRGGSPYVGE